MCPDTDVTKVLNSKQDGENIKQSWERLASDGRWKIRGVIRECRRNWGQESTKSNKKVQVLSLSLETSSVSLWLQKTRTAQPEHRS